MAAELVKVLLTLRWAALGTAALTLAAFFLMQLLLLRLRVQGNRLVGLFVGLQGRSLLLLALAWVKFAFFTAVLASAQAAALSHYLLLGALALCTFLVRPGLSPLLTEAVGGGLLAAGFFVCGTLLDFLRQIRDDSVIRTSYWLLAAFLILCAAVLLVREAVVASGERNRFDETGETE